MTKSAPRLCRMREGGRGGIASPPTPTVALTVAVTRRVLVRARAAAREKGRFDLHDTLGELQCSRDTCVMAAASHAYCPLVSLDEPPQFTSPSTNSLQCLAWAMRFPELVASTVRVGVEKSSLSAHTPPTHPLPPPQRETEPVTATGPP